MFKLGSFYHLNITKCRQLVVHGHQSSFTKDFLFYRRVHIPSMVIFQSVNCLVNLLTCLGKCRKVYCSSHPCTIIASFLVIAHRNYRSFVGCDMLPLLPFQLRHTPNSRSFVSCNMLPLRPSFLWYTLSLDHLLFVTNLHLSQVGLALHSLLALSTFIPQHLAYLPL